MHFDTSNHKIKVRPTNNSDKGKGIFALQDIRKGEVFGEMDGKILNREEYKKLPERCKKYCNEINDHELLCPFDCKNPGKFWFINHSCEPNLGSAGDYFHFIAMKDIKAGEELTLDYAMIDNGEITDTEKMECKCGSKNCRHFITTHDWQIPELQEKYKGYFQKNVQEKINKQKRAVVQR